MVMHPKKHPHSFSINWFAGDESEDSWFSYLHRNSGHISGEQIPFQDTSWTYYEDDLILHDEILKRLYEEEELDASSISVIVMHGNVDLEGEVKSEQEKELAQKVVAKIPDVWRVQNDLRIAS